MADAVKGTALYFRAISATHSPAELVRRCKALGLTWAAIGAVWQEFDRKAGRLKTGWMNPPEKCREFLDALAGAGIDGYVWGYPWAGMVDQFISGMVEASGDHRKVLLDPELGMSPPKDPKVWKPATDGPSLAAARAMASKLVVGLRRSGATRIGLSTYGVVPRWFPLDAFLREGLDFAGGQTYTDDARVDSSIASFLEAFKAAGLEPGDVQLVPNFGTYSWEQAGGERRARAKTEAEQAHHLMEFVDEGEPVRALVGWAANFVRWDAHGAPVGNGRALARFSGQMARGACALPVAT